MKNNIAIYLSAGSHNGRAQESPIRLTALTGRGLTVEHYTVNTRNLFSGLLFTLQLATRKRPEVVIAFEYYCAFFACLAFGWRRSTQVFVIGLNQSRRLLRFGSRISDGAINRIFGRLGLIIVHSQAEADQFSEIHAIPRERFAFAHWGYDLPAFTPPDSASDVPPPVCMIGRNNRDYGCFVKASDLAGFRGLIVAPAYSGLPTRPGPEVETAFDIPMADCIARMSGAAVNVVALVDRSRGAGHITMVSAMHLGKPQVVSEASQIADYIIDGVNGLLVPVGNAEMLAAAIARLLADPTLARHLGETGRTLAQEFMSHAAFLGRLDTVIDAALRGERFDFVDASWTTQLQKIRAEQATLAEH
ncbi:MAG: glycosyltransferase [Cypionkella sp.]